MNCNVKGLMTKNEGKKNELFTILKTCFESELFVMEKEEAFVLLYI